MRSAARLAVLIGMVSVAGCAARPPPKTADSPHADGAFGHGYDAGYAAGRVRGRAETYQKLRNDPAFSVTYYQLSACRDEVAWLPRTGAIPDIAFWRARQRMMWLLDQCRKRNAAKIPVIYRMIDRVRAGADP